MGVYTQHDRYYGRFCYNKVRYNGYALNEFTADKVEPRNKKEAQAAFELFCGEVRTGKIIERNRPAALSTTMLIPAFIAQYNAEYFEKKKRQPDTCIDVIARYFDGKPLSLWNDPATFVTFKSWLMNAPIWITKTYKDGRQERTATTKMRTPATWNRYYARLHHMAKFARAFKLIETFPFDGDDLTEFIGREEEAEGRKRGVTDSEQAALYTACDQLRDPQAMRDRLDIALSLGCRQGEMLNSQLEDINFDQRTLTFPGHKTIDGVSVRNTKSGKSRRVPIDDLMPLFDRKRTAAKGTEWPFKLNPKYFLFGTEGHRQEDFDVAFANLKEHASLADVDLHWHDLRGEAGTRMLRNGASYAQVAEVLGNTEEIVRKHYKGDLLDSLRKVVAK